MFFLKHERQPSKGRVVMLEFDSEKEKLIEVASHEVEGSVQVLT